MEKQIIEGRLSGMSFLSCNFSKCLILAVIASLALQARHTANSKTDISGKWHFVLQTEGGERDRDANFQQDGKKVSGKWADADVQGTFDNGKLDLEFPIKSEEAGEGTLKLKGELTEDSLNGTWEFQVYSGTFKATRVQ
ncbi:MAG: hypothetical protein JOY62_16050 [Acidobacteriaceae bacterium]|nr:hypothetical protein [Acidobacteriaceae bacterium]MBV9781476.1 hypothetical protein [Acidobacteriaceae bacterium]